MCVHACMPCMVDVGVNNIIVITIKFLTYVSSPDPILCEGKWVYIVNNDTILGHGNEFGRPNQITALLKSLTQEFRGAN